MKWRVITAALVLVVPAMAAGLPHDGEASAQLPKDPSLGERVFALAMDGNAFNGETWPNTPLLEAYEGERLTFVVLVPPGAEMHTFHLHGHPWEDPRSSGETIDAILLDPGEAHAFQVTAGLGEGHAGDWLYHCHVSDHFEQGMWGLLRVYPYAMAIDGPLDELTLTLTDDGEGLEQASIQAHLRSDGGPTSAAELGEGEPVAIDVEELGGGEYRIAPDLPEDAAGQLVLTAEHEGEQSLARLDLGEDGYELARDVPGPSGPSVSEMPGVALDQLGHLDAPTPGTVS